MKHYAVFFKDKLAFFTPTGVKMALVGASKKQVTKWAENMSKKRKKKFEVHAVTIKKVK